MSFLRLYSPELSPEQKRLIKGIDGPKKPASEPRTYYVPRN